MFPRYSCSEANTLNLQPNIINPFTYQTDPLKKPEITMVYKIENRKDQWDLYIRQIAPIARELIVRSRSVGQAAEKVDWLPVVIAVDGGGRRVQLRT